MSNNTIIQDKISLLANDINVRLRNSINSIQHVNRDIHVLSINAKIQAAKAGSQGKTFSVIAEAIRAMVDRTDKITGDLQSNVEETVDELMELNNHLGSKVRGERLSQVAENMIDIIDRNLYERSCDVRWWATESAVVQAMTRQSENVVKTCCKRLGQILDSYTVYYDLVLCDLDGKIIANGRPEKFKSIGMNAGSTGWFKSALRTSSGEDYGFQGVHRSPFVNDEFILAYSCGVRTDGNPHGELLGILGILFRWQGLGNIVTENAAEMLSSETEYPLRAVILDSKGQSIASNDGEENAFADKIIKQVRSSVRGYILPKDKGDKLVGFASSKGFETYKTGWFALIEEKH